MSEAKQKPVADRRIRSFVRRTGRLTPGQQRALDEIAPKHALDLTQPMDADTLNKQFQKKQPITLEIGFGDGDALTTLASQRPNHNFIGMEVHRPGVGRALLSAERLALENLKIIEGDAVDLCKQLPDASLHQVLVYFPDPWHKARHNKRRLINPKFATELARLIAKDGYLRLATDWEDYAEQMLEVLNANNQFNNCSPEAQFVPRPDERPVTKFERRGERLGHTMRDLAFRKIS